MSYITLLKEKRTFSELAEFLLNGTLLQCGSRLIRICEVEFYLHTQQHPDQYTHCHIEQAQYGKWYFHRYNNGTYKNGTYKV